jgi:hypothetical protein
MKILPIFLSITPLIAGVVLSRSILVENYSQTTEIKSDAVVTKRTIQQDLKNILELQKQSLMKLLPSAPDETLIYNDKGEIIGIKTPEPVLASVSTIAPPNLNNITTPIGKFIFNNPLTRVSPVLAVGSVTPTPTPASLSQAAVSTTPTVVESTITPTPTPTEIPVTPIPVKTKPVVKPVVKKTVQATQKKKSTPKVTSTSKQVAQGGVVTQVVEQPKSVEVKKEERKEQKEERKEEKREEKQEKKEPKSKD